MDPSPPARSIDGPIRPRLDDGARLRDDPRGGGAVLLYPEGLLHLNETARSVLALCDGRRTLAEIAATLAPAFEGPVDDLAGDVAEFLGCLGERRLVVLRPGGGDRR